MWVLKNDYQKYWIKAIYPTQAILSVMKTFNGNLIINYFIRMYYTAWTMTQLAITYSELTTETPEQGVIHVKS